MRQLLFILLLAAISSNSFAQNEAYNPYEQLKIGQQHYLIADQVNIRAAATTSSAKVGQLSISTTIILEEKSPETLTLNGLTAPWYRISFQQNGQSKNGYIWGGFIALGYLQDPDYPNTLFLYGFSRKMKDMVNGYPRSQLYMQVRACAENREISKVEFEALGVLATGLDATITDNKGVKGIQNILQFSFNDGYCGGAFGMQVVFWDGLKLHHIRKLNNGFDMPYFKHEFFIYPDDNLGVKDMIILQMEEGRYDDNGNPQYDQKFRKEFSWLNGQLQLLDMGDNQP
jgi:hypothetical protein